MKKILVIYTSVGMGHKIVGQSIVRALRNSTDHKILELDIFKQNETAFTRGFEKVYTHVITEAQWIWSAIYKSSLFNKLTLPLRVPYAQLNSKKFEEFLSRIQPDLIVTTHTVASAMTAAMKRSGKYKGPFVISFSDWHFHPYYFYKEADRVLVQTQEQMERLISLGYPRERIVITGLPVNEAFAQRHNEGEVYRAFNLSRIKPLILMMGGSRGWGVRQEDVNELLQTKYDVQIAVVTGTDKELRRRLIEKVEGHHIPVRVFGFLSSEDLAKLFQIAKILVTKPGGSTIGEALASNLPMVLANPLPAMEEFNQDFLVGRGAAVKAKGPEEIRQWIERLLQDKKLYQELREQMKELNPKDASKLAARAIIDMLEQYDYYLVKN